MESHHIRLRVMTPISTALCYTQQIHSNWLQRLDLNQRFPAYETSEDDQTPLLRDKLAVLFSTYNALGIYAGSADGTAYSKLAP